MIWVKGLSKLLDKGILKYLDEKSEKLEFTTDDYLDSVSSGVKNLFCKKILLSGHKSNLYANYL